MSASPTDFGKNVAPYKLGGSLATTAISSSGCGDLTALSTYGHTHRPTRVGGHPAEPRDPCCTPERRLLCEWRALLQVRPS